MSSADALSVAAHLAFANAHGQVAVMALGTQAQVCLACFSTPVPAAWQASWGDGAREGLQPSAAWQGVAHCMAQEPAAVLLLLDASSPLAHAWATPWAQALQAYGAPVLVVELQAEAGHAPDDSSAWGGGKALRAACQGWLQVPALEAQSPENGKAHGAVDDPVLVQAVVAGHFYDLLQASLAVGVASFGLQDILDCMVGARSRMRLVAEQAASPEEAMRRLDAALEGLGSGAVQQAGIFIQPGALNAAAVGKRTVKHLGTQLPNASHVMGAAWQPSEASAHAALTLITSEDPDAVAYYAS